jgi:nicotinamidase-related amidase
MASALMVIDVQRGLFDTRPPPAEAEAVIARKRPRRSISPADPASVPVARIAATPVPTAADRRPNPRK